MRIRPSMARLFWAVAIPAFSLMVISYFGFYALWGERGLLELKDIQARLGAQQRQLAEARGQRDQLYHRIQLMDQKDPDLVEELARGQLMDAGPGQVAVPRTAH